MRRLAAVLVFAGAFVAQGQQLGVQLRDLQLRSGESHALTVLGATSAWAVDAEVVDVALSNGSLVITGRAAGRTTIVVALRSGEATFTVSVAGTTVRQPHSKSQTPAGLADIRYSSAAQEVTSSVTISGGSDSRHTEVQATVAHSSLERTTQPATTVPALTYRISTPDRELTFFDRMVDYSPLTLSAAALRGVHYIDDHWRVHAGLTAWSSQRSFLLPVDREKVAGAGYALSAGRNGTITPGFFAYSGKGTIASLLYEYREGNRLEARGELALSHGVGAALQLNYADGGDRARVDVRFRPRDFAAVGPGDLRGLLGDASWSHDWNNGANATFAASATDLFSIGERATSASSSFEVPVASHWKATAGGSWGTIGDARSVEAPIGIRADYARGGFGGRYRWSRNSATDRGSHGVRVFAHANAGSLRVSGYVDRTEDAPTLSLIFRQQPELALALEELGLEVSSPADVARALRENAALIAMGYIEGVTIDLAPVRTQFGFDASWTGTGASRRQLRARFLRNIAETVSGRTVTTIASLTWSQRITRDTDAFARYSMWKMARRGADSLDEPFVEVGIRHRFDDLPSILPRGTTTLEGLVFSDEDLDGTSDGSGIAGAEVELDGIRRATTAADGSFRFERVERGTHTVIARIPSRPEAYFTTPSRVELTTGDDLSFGVAMTPARLRGRVVSDAGKGVSGASVSLVRGSIRAGVPTASDGSFEFAVAPGEWELSISPESLPPGYTSLAPQKVALIRMLPQTKVLVVRAQRSIAVVGLPPAGVLLVQPGERSLQAGADGRIAIRSLPAGPVTLQAAGSTRTLVLPAGPGIITVDFGATATATAAVRPEPQATALTATFVVQLGAFREPGNADEARQRASTAGIDTGVSEARGLIFVQAGPYSSRAEAEQVASRLEGAGLETLVRATQIPVTRTTSSKVVMPSASLRSAL